MAQHPVEEDRHQDAQGEVAEEHDPDGKDVVEEGEDVNGEPGQWNGRGVAIPDVEEASQREDHGGAERHRRHHHDGAPPQPDDGCHGEQEQRDAHVDTGVAEHRARPRSEQLDVGRDDEALQRRHVVVEIPERSMNAFRSEELHVQGVSGERDEDEEGRSRHSQHVVQPLANLGAMEEGESEEGGHGHDHRLSEQLLGGHQLERGDNAEEQPETPWSRSLPHQDLVGKDDRQRRIERQGQVGMTDALGDHVRAEAVEEAPGGGGRPRPGEPACSQVTAPPRGGDGRHAEDVVGGDRTEGDGDRRQQQGGEDDGGVPHQVGAARVVDVGGQQRVEVVPEGKGEPLQVPDEESGILETAHRGPRTGEEALPEHRHRQDEVHSEGQRTKCHRQEPRSPLL